MLVHQTQLKVFDKFKTSVILISISILSLTSGLKLNSNGGYDVIVAIQEGSEYRGESYIESIKGIIRTFSTKLFIASRETFYIESVDILVPSSWARNPVYSIETTSVADVSAQSFQTADLRIGDSIQWPYVENPNICGRPGEFISFPSNIFNSHEGFYGQTWRALINQWALYRWGVHEEHGYPGDDRFPYFYKESPLANSWSTTGCSNVEIKGKIVNKFGEFDDSENCDIYSDDGPSADCRFQPSRTGNTAVTSLMHFQFLDSMTEFCDTETHVRSAPNKQNLFCGYRSVWEVIRETPDFRAVLDPISDGRLPIVQFRTRVISDKPVLYVLVDKGHSELQKVVEKLTGKAAELFNANIPETFASLGTFPNLRESSNMYVDERVGWSTISTSKSEFISAMIDDPTDRLEYRDFGLAILESVKLIKARNPPGGAVLLIIKTGAAKNSFDSLTYEEEIFGALLHERIKLVALELRVDVATPYINLEGLVNRVDGIHEMITPSNIDGDIIPRVIQNIENLLSGGPIPEITKSLLIYRGPVIPANHPINFPHPQFVTIFYPPNLKMLNFSLSVSASANVLLTLEEGVIGFNRPEWDENVDSQKRKTIPAYLPITGDRQTMGGFFDFAYICREGANNCSDVIGQLIVCGDLEDDLDPESEVVDVDVYTSALNGIVDLNKTGSSDTPFSIFARVSVKGVPVANLTAEALIRKTGEKISVGWTVPLTDDGFGSPDILENDGIYSAAFIPPLDGLFGVTVNVYNREVVQSPTLSPSTRLVPVDQTQLDCSVNYHCEAVTLSKYFGTSKDLLIPVYVINRDLFVPGKPTKINTLEVRTVEEAGIEVRFKSPGLVGIGNENDENVTYIVYISDTLEALLEDLSNPNITRKILAEDVSSRPPGSTELYMIPWYDEEIDVVVYMALQTISGEWESALSNIRSVFVNTTGTTVSPQSSTESTDTTLTSTTETSESSTVDNTDTTTVTSNSPDPTATTGSTTETEDPESTVSTSTVSESTVSISTFDPTSSDPTSSTIDDSTTGVSTPSTTASVPTTTTTTTSTETPQVDGDDPFFETTWGIVVIILIVLIGLTAVGGILYFCKRRQANRDYSSYRWRRSDYSTSAPGNKRSTSIFDDGDSPGVAALSRNTRLPA